ncbi:MAG: heparan-alpha-glucosaminide N-acetyltransferase domain-containing protein [Spirochaetota bacterium]
MRLNSIDQYRGFAILVMVLANYLAGIETIPGWLKHAPDIGLTVVDLIAPFFIFAVALNYSISYERRREQQSRKAAVRHFLTRYLALIGIGSILSCGELLVGFKTSGIPWGVLQAIGAAGLLTLPLIRTPPVVRLSCGALLLAIYQFLLDAFWLKTVFPSSHGGMLGSLSWAGMLIISTALADLFHTTTQQERDQKSTHIGSGRLRIGPWLYPVVSLCILIGGIIISIWIPVSKNRVSASYILISTGGSALLFFIFHMATDMLKFKLPFLTYWGRNPLMLYLAHQLLLALFVFPGGSRWYVNAAPGLIVLQTLFLLSGLSLLAWFLQRKGRTFSL